MAQDADNDNGTRSAIDAIRAAAPNWTNYGPGGTALAASATADRAPDAPDAPDAAARASSEANPSSPGGLMNMQADSIPTRLRNRGELRIVFSGPPPVPVTTRV